MLTILIERNPLIIDRYIFFLTKSLTNICQVLNQITLKLFYYGMKKAKQASSNIISQGTMC